MFTWSRYGGYECSTKGDKRFSAFNAILPDGLTIEFFYQTKIKGYHSIKSGKGKPPLDPSMDLWKEYLNLWRIWANNNLPLMRELYFSAKSKNCILSDCFASTPVNQAHALSEILNELIQRK